MQHLSDAERRRRQEVLKLVLQDLEKPAGTRLSGEGESYLSFLGAQAERTQSAKDDARANGRELITPLGAAELFKKAAPTVRRAVAEGFVAAPLTLHATGKPVALLQLSSATAYWGEPDGGAVDQMRENGHVLGVDGLAYNVLSPEPLLTLNDPGELE